jgi:hypothetical protein
MAEQGIHMQFNTGEVPYLKNIFFMEDRIILGILSMYMSG